MPVYQRLVMILKLRSTSVPGMTKVDTEKRLPEGLQGHPEADIEMLLPAARVRLLPLRPGQDRPALRRRHGDGRLEDRGDRGWPCDRRPASHRGPERSRRRQPPRGLLGHCHRGRRLRQQLVLRLPGHAAALQPDLDGEPVLPEPRQQRRRAVPPARRGRGAGMPRGHPGVLLPVALRRRQGLDRPRPRRLHRASTWKQART